jgi:hypothetical protein
LWGEERAFQALQFWMVDHYRWIYRQFLESGYQIGPIVQKNGLIPGSPAAKPAAR